MKIKYVSDLHLEFLDYPDFSNERGGEVLLLAGDIVTASAIQPHRTDANAKKLQKYLKTRFKSELIDKFDKVFMVMGNHEHYRSIFKNTKTELETGFEQLDLDKIKILENDFVHLDEDTVLVGCTLWSDFEKNNMVSKLVCQRGMSDFLVIGAVDAAERRYLESNCITPDFLIEQHNASIGFITTLINQEPFKDKSIVVMTHHGPTMTSLHKHHVGNGLDGAYCSDLSNLILDHPNIRYWVHGHTHIHCRYSVGERCYVVANCRGYRGEFSHKIWNGLSEFKV